MTDPELAELERNIAQAEMRLAVAEMRLAEMQKRRAKAKQARLTFNKAKAALEKFNAKGPRKKKKSGRPSFWRGLEGLMFVSAVQKIIKERGCKTAAAIRVAARKRREAWGNTGPVAARLTKALKDRQLEVRYQEARRYWSYVIDPEHQKKREALRRDLDQARA